MRQEGTPLAARPPQRDHVSADLSDAVEDGPAHRAQAVAARSRTLRNRNAFSITEAELKAIANAATTSGCVEVVKPLWWRGLDSNQRRRAPTDLQSVPFSRSGTPPAVRSRALLPIPCACQRDQPPGPGRVSGQDRRGGPYSSPMKPPYSGRPDGPRRPNPDGDSGRPQHGPSRRESGPEPHRGERRASRTQVSLQVRSAASKSLPARSRSGGAIMTTAPDTTSIRRASARPRAARSGSMASTPSRRRSPIRRAGCDGCC